MQGVIKEAEKQLPGPGERGREQHLLFYTWHQVTPLCGTRTEEKSDAGKDAGRDAGWDARARHLRAPSGS